MTTRILVIQLRQLGDIILTTPCARELKRFKRDVHVTFLAHRMGKIVLEANPFIDEMFYYDENDGLLAQIELMRRIRAKKFDIALDFMNNPRSAIMTYASAATERVAFASKRRFFYNHLVPRANTREYIVAEKFKLLQAIGVEASDQRLVLPWFENHVGTSIKYMHENPTLRDAPIRVILSPTHRRARRRWPLACYAALSDALTRDWSAAVTWLWGPGEEAEIDAGMKFCKEKAFRAPKTSFREMAALIANHDLFIGNSNGPSHVAVSTDICTLQLHGHTNAVSWCPLNARHWALQSSTQHSDPSHAMEAIGVDQVLALLHSQKALIEASAQARQRLSMRVNWTQELPR